MDIKSICAEVKGRLDGEHIGCFEGRDKPLLLISTTYPGVWLEHVYDAVFYAAVDRSKLYIAENTIDLFISNQKEDGQLPCYVLDEKRLTEVRAPVGYKQIQECVSFARLCYTVYKLNKNRDFLTRVYTSSKKWAEWLRKNRMTAGRGLIEMFVGFDTGHDRSGRLKGLSCPGAYSVGGVWQNAAVLPKNDPVAPILAVDMSCNYYATLTSLSKMAKELALNDEAESYKCMAAELKKKLFEQCYDRDDAFFYDVDKNGKLRKYLSSTVFHLFMEGVLDPEEDKEIIDAIYERHISNPREFATPYPYPSMAICDPSCEGHAENNCWGYYSQGLIALRSTLWMKKYGFDKEYENLKSKWVEAWTMHYEKIKMGQELDPTTGEPTDCSEWYSSTMLFYLYAAGALGELPSGL